MTQSTRDAHDALVRILEPAVRDVGVDLEELEIRTAGRRRLVRVLVDADGGVDLDRVAQVSTAISAVLDREPAATLLGQSPYVLEVSSPGVDRPLTLPRHWRRAIARLVAVTLTDGAQVTGRITAADDTSATVEVEGALHVLDFDRVQRAQVQVEFRSGDPRVDDDVDVEEGD